MSRSKFFVTVNCDDCRIGVTIEIPERYLHHSQTMVSEILRDMGWVVDDAKVTDYCSACCPLKEGG